MKKSLDFYNDFSTKLLNDYVNGNKRMEKAIIKLSSFIKSDCKNILDIGCGIGWSTHEFANYFKQAEVIGIDFSPNLIEVANSLFNIDNLSFKVSDVTKNSLNQKFEAIIMIDVYEHIMIENRKLFHSNILKNLDDHGRLILACPSKFHQNWLKNNLSEGLQPIDEIIDIADIIELAKDIDAEVIHFEYQTIWKSLDYFYAVIERKPIYGLTEGIKYQNNIELELKTDRIKRIERNLEDEFQNFKTEKYINGSNRTKNIIKKFINRLK